MKIEESVFDRRSLFTLYEFINKGVLASVDYPISTGKEADVYRATTGEKFRKESEFTAVKIFRIETASFHRMQDYIYADPRFLRVKHVKRAVIYAWAQKEFKNLQICQEAGVRAPKPFAFSKNILLMEFLGEGGVPDSTLKELGSENPEKDLETILDYVRRLYRHGLVHADLSEFNVLMHGYPPVPYLIDIGQGVLTKHPKAEEFLRRDVENILNYFSGYGVRKDPEKVLRWVRGSATAAL